jgi:hypothetical protein
VVNALQESKFCVYDMSEMVLLQPHHAKLYAGNSLLVASANEQHIAALALRSRKPREDSRIAVKHAARRTRRDSIHTMPLIAVPSYGAS